jgi:hypothetical protein
MALGDWAKEQRVPLFVFVCKRVSEYFREASVLIMVFAILDKIVFEHKITAPYVVGVLAVSFLFLVLGICLERRFGGA